MSAATELTGIATVAGQQLIVDVHALATAERDEDTFHRALRILVVSGVRLVEKEAAGRAGRDPSAIIDALERFIAPGARGSVTCWWCSRKPHASDCAVPQATEALRKYRETY